MGVVLPIFWVLFIGVGAGAYLYHRLRGAMCKR